MDPTLKRQFKSALYEQFARISRAMANPHRLELLDLLTQGERTVEDLARETALSVANASQHLQTLRSANLVAVRRDGLYAHYRLADQSVRDLWLTLRAVGESRLADVQQVVQSFLHDRSPLQALGIDDLRQRIASDSVLLLDVRPALEYGAGHLPQARSIPIDELSSRLHELPVEQPIVAYCRGPYCVFADEAVALLTARGYSAYRLEAGVAEWQAQGYPVSHEGASHENN